MRPLTRFCGALAGHGKSLLDASSLLIRELKVNLFGKNRSVTDVSRKPQTLFKVDAVGINPSSILTAGEERCLAPKDVTIGYLCNTDRPPIPFSSIKDQPCPYEYFGAYYFKTLFYEYGLSDGVDSLLYPYTQVNIGHIEGVLDDVRILRILGARSFQDLYYLCGEYDIGPVTQRCLKERLIKIKGL